MGTKNKTLIQDRENIDGLSLVHDKDWINIRYTWLFR